LDLVVKGGSIESVSGVAMPDGFPQLVEDFADSVASAEADSHVFQNALRTLRDYRQICARVMHARPELLATFHGPWKRASDRLAQLEAKTGAPWPPAYFDVKPHLKTVETFLSAPVSDGL
jgi:hypothetical protein